MYAVRLWAVRHSRLMQTIYAVFERTLVACDPLLRRIGYERLERPTAMVERQIKGFLFDCKMCGQCALSSTGISCPMNCPKNLRNGPCGGVRPDGHCEVRPEMRCVWVEAWQGSRHMPGGDRIMDVQKPIDQRLWGRSAWLRVLRARREPKAADKPLERTPTQTDASPSQLRKAA